MSTKIDMINDAFVSVAENIKAREVTLRMFLAAVSLSALLTIPSVITMNYLMVMAVYFFTTAVMRWDPVYALFNIIRVDKNLSRQNSYKASNEGSLINGVDRKSEDPAANDAGESIDNMKKAS